MKEFPTTFFCPVCEHNLQARKTKHKVALWCPHYACPDARMNDGAVGRTQLEAFRQLQRKAQPR